MPVESHLCQLERKHRALELEIQSELHRPACDDTRLTALKRQKLTLKDRIHQLRNGRAAT